MPAFDSALGEEIHGALSPLPEEGQALRVFAHALAAMFAQVEFYARATEHPGWSVIHDLDRAPDVVLPYLGQLVGQTVPVGTPTEQARDLIRTPNNAERGTVPAIAKAVTDHLTGFKFVRIIERDTSAYHFTIYVRTNEVPAGAEDLITRAVDAIKPAGVMWDIVVSDGTTIDELTGTIDALAGAIDDLAS